MGFWTSIDDNLPNLGIPVLIQVDDGNKYVSTRERCQVFGNDFVHWKFKGPGPFSFFAQSVTHWAYIPELRA